MTKLEMAKILKPYEDLYSKNFTEKQVEIWYKYFKDWPKEEFGYISEIVITKVRWFPAIADFYSLRDELTKGGPHGKKL